ncbi:hypothetical protein MRX96_000517 [Rhipicephalus microplus]
MAPRRQSRATPPLAWGLGHGRGGLVFELRENATSGQETDHPGASFQPSTRSRPARTAEAGVRAPDSAGPAAPELRRDCHHEPSFLLACWHILVAAIGLCRRSFPRHASLMRCLLIADT